MTSRVLQGACSPSAARRAFRPTCSKPRCARKAAKWPAPCISLGRESSERRKAAPRSPCSIRRRCRSRGSRRWSARKCCCNRARGRAFRRSCANGARRFTRCRRAACAGTWTSTRSSFRSGGFLRRFFRLSRTGLAVRTLEDLAAEGAFVAFAHAQNSKIEKARDILPSLGLSRPSHGYNTRHLRISMSAEVKAHLTELLTRALAKVAPQQPGSLISLERPKQSQHGDFSCPAAMQLARVLKRNPRELALELVAALPPSEWLQRAGGAGTALLNLRVRPAPKQQSEKTMLSARARYGRAESRRAAPGTVELVSASLPPTL